MNWISFEDKKPEESGFYFVIYRSNLYPEPLRSKLVSLYKEHFSSYDYFNQDLCKILYWTPADLPDDVFKDFSFKNFQKVTYE
jgi:hypothetical protein